MATVIIMPKQGQSVESCIITLWNKNPGDSVKKGEILFSYETDKASFEEEAPVDGVLLGKFFEEGDEVPVLTNVCVMGEKGESIDEFAPGNGTTDTTVEEEIMEPQGEEKIKEVSETGKFAVETETEKSEFIGISPRAKNLANSKGLDLSGIKGTGPHGRIIEQDIKKVLAEKPKVTPLAQKVSKDEQLMTGTAGTGLAGAVTAKDLSPANPVYSSDSVIKPVTNMRKIIAEAMYKSLQNSAQLTHHLGADARRILELRQKVKKAMDEGSPDNITLNDMVCFAVIKTLKQFPNVNTHFLGDSIRYFNKVHLGLAVDTERGLMVPALKNADDLTIRGLSAQLKELAATCRKGSIDPELLSSEAATFTVSNLGNYGVEMFTPVINLPQSAILGVNTIVPRPKDLGNGAYGFVPYIGLSLTYDHRSLDGGEATMFVKQVAIEIENLEFDL